LKPAEDPKILISDANCGGAATQPLKSSGTGLIVSNGLQFVVVRIGKQQLARADQNAEQDPTTNGTARSLDVQEAMTEADYGEAYVNDFPETLRILMSRGMNYSTAEELCEWAWVRGWERRSQLRDRRKLRSWIITIALNRHREMYRREVELACANSVTCELNLDARIDVSTLLQLCTEENRNLLQGQLEGLSIKELSQINKITVAAAYKRCERALAWLRSAVLKTGGRQRLNGHI
jgi:DNA-directed RNA polymerase specialized sigma24 family protein